MAFNILEVSIDIHRPITDVIAFVGNNNNDPMWQTAVLQSEQLSTGEPTVGTLYHVKEKFLGRVIEQNWEVTERNADGSFWKASSITGPFPMKTSMRFEANGDNSTTIHRTLSIDVGRFFKVASPVVGHIAKREIQTAFANLKELLETEAVTLAE
ncbi:MAG: hypothetical protein AUJ57_05655 [Zetaproteobacteria bacterium CG1_02_53_45]|nr:MAG: hypothetical protein AUJ57_05655 [Zetaproteobacteria bacterium CG1_02_53_45]